MSSTTVGASADREASRVGSGVIAATVAGNAIEFYDFLCFNYFAVYIAGAYFPPGDETTNLLKTLAVFWSGFLFRPLGGVLIGAFADRAGRRPAMMLTIALITLGTLGLALVPSYATIGVAAPALLVFCRIVQGFALGGEVGPASVFLIEAAPPGARGFYASWQIASQGLAGIAAGAIGVALAWLLSKQQMADWGWRVPFVLCLALMPVAFYLRGEMPETLKARQPVDKGGLAPHAGYVALGVAAIVGATVSTYVGSNMATYATTTLKLPPALAQSASLIGGASIFAFGLLGGFLGDRFGRKPVVLAPRVALLILIWPLFAWLSASPSAISLWVSTIAVAGLTALSAGVALVILPELLPPRVRATGFAVSYALGVSIFGGSTPAVVTWLVSITHNPVAPAWYVMLTSLVTIAALLALPETLGRKLD